MKKRGIQRIMEMVMMVAATRGMVCREKTKRFMRIPPNSIPKAAAGRFTAPGERKERFGSVCAGLGVCVGTDTEHKGAQLPEGALEVFHYSSNT